jgi:hypothetical protein
MQTMYYIGLDVHKRTISYCVKDGSGAIHAEGTVAFRRWGSVANSVFVTLLRGGVHLILANHLWRQLQDRAEKIPGDKKHVEATLSQSYCVAQFNLAHKLPSSGR